MVVKDACEGVSVAWASEIHVCLESVASVANLRILENLADQTRSEIDSGGSRWWPEYLPHGIGWPKDGWPF